MEHQPKSPVSPTSFTSTVVSDGGPRAHPYHIRRPSVETGETPEPRWLPEKNRVELRFAPASAEPFGVALLEYRDHPHGLWTVVHCEVPLEHANEGYEGKMMELLLRSAQEQGVRVKNTCGGAVKRWIEEDLTGDLKDVLNQ